jgi:hypothetical protein
LEQPILTIGGVREWDANKIGVDAVFPTDDGYRLYYTSNQGNSVAVGMATSSDGLVWEKYNDPTTDDRKYVSSDPVFGASERGNWDDGGIQTPSIRRTDSGYEMVYSGYTNLPQDPSINYFLVGIGYAYSEDGISWTRVSDNPLFLSDSEEGPLNPSFYETENGLFVMYAMLQQTNRGLIGGRIDRAELIISDE